MFTISTSSSSSHSIWMGRSPAEFLAAGLAPATSSSVTAAGQLSRAAK
eukprot:CAMPEP_0177790062 /NCGR_PEP_ID=MMETSP0491_2-20121128/23122_1 /TAXON_ID=63592 /ORGANISM="Tetraselmis chuii, Strain PLY429" /LENGTH=47 /DNA_ID= /DNA_START= /DNA_END= /DNA_ORIENTATION=